MLMTSLPLLGDPFAQTRTPLPRSTLERRLTLLDAADEALLLQVERLVQWESIGEDVPDAEMLRRLITTITDLQTARLPDLADAVQYRLELRSIVTALRHRHFGWPLPPPASAPWRVSRHAARIAANWDAPDLGLSIHHRWVSEAQSLLDSDEPLALERLMLGEAWRDLSKRAARHHFDFTSVAIYVLRWNIFDRWTRYDGGDAVVRFDGLIAAGLSSFDAQFAELGIDV